MQYSYICIVKNNAMKIVVLKGSPRKSGNSNWLADQFTKGATEAGHEVAEFDCTRHKVGGCMACNACGMNGPCVQQDEFAPLREQLLAADAIVLATPIYYFGVSAQLKTVIDRFYSLNAVIGGKKSVFIATMGNPDMRVGDSARMMYDKMVAYLGWEDCGQLIGPGVWAAGDIQQTAYGRQACDLGRNL